VESLGAGETISLEILNDLSSAEGRGEHYAIVRVDSNSQVSERDELNNSESVYYYDGEYLDEYTAMRANLPSWVTEIKDRLNSEYDFSCTGVVYLRLVDDMGNISGSMAAPYLFGSSEVTPVLMFNLKRLHDGYTTYESGGVIYTSDTSQEVIFHEYTHAYHCYYAIDNQGIWPPAWFREGFAVYVAGHGPGIVKRMIYKCKVSGEAFAETADRIMDGLQSDEEHDAYDYAEDYLALQYIVSNYGQSSLKNIVRDSSFGASIEVAVLDNIAESDWDTFEESVNTYGRASIEAIYPLVN